MTTLEFDRLDLKLLGLLQRDASLSQRELAEQANSSPATVLRRIERLKSIGVIEREVAILNPAHLGHFLQVIAEVTLDRQDISSHDQFEQSLLPLDQIQQCYRVTAGPDFILVITVENMDAYQQLAREVFSARYNVRNVRAFFSTQRSKFTTLQPLPCHKTS